MKKILLISFVLLTALIGESWSQERTISGKVTSAEDGSTLPGVNVVLKGTTSGTITDVDGNYTLPVPSGGEGTYLVFSFIGLETQEIEIGARSVVDLAMSADVTELSEVVIDALGVAKETKSLGYSVQKVGGDNLNKARDVNLVNALSGRISGVQVTNTSGATGASSRIVLRGATSVSGNNQPLFVVDGIPISNGNFSNAGSSGGFDQPNGAADINPDDIETVTVLKGANAAALYGARAANGVILITTKKGNKGEGIGVSVNSSTQFLSPLKMPSFQNSYGQGGNENSFVWQDGSSKDGGVDESWGPPLDIGLSFPQFTSNGKKHEPWVSAPKSIENFYETGVLMSNNVALSGGNDRATFRISLTNAQENGIIPNTGLDRNTINVASSFDLTEKLYSNFSVSYIKTNSDNLPIGGYNNENPVQQMIWSGRQVDYAALKDYSNLPLAAKGTAAAGTPLNWNNRYQNNPYWVLNNNLNQLEKDRIIGNVKIGYKVTDWFTVQVKTGTDFWSNVQRSQKAKGSNNHKEGRYVEVNRDWYETNSDLLFMINKSINEDFDINFNLGGNQMHQKYTRISSTAPQLEFDKVYNISNLKSGATGAYANSIREKRINSVYFSGGVSFRQYLFLEFSGRNDWSSVLPKGSNSFFYPSVSLSTVVTDALDIQSDVLSFLKVRGSWAQVGGDGALTPYRLTNPYLFRATPFGKIGRLHVGQTLNNSRLKPETTTSIEFGVDARLWNGKLTLDVTYFDTKSKDLLVPVQVSASTGYHFAWNNVGEMSNRGIELQIGARVLEIGDFSWDVNVNWAKINNEVVSLGGLESFNLGSQWGLTLQAREKQPYGVLFGKALERTKNGEIVYKNGLPQIAEKSKVLGDIQPDWTGGISTQFSFKGITLSGLIDAKIGGEIHSMTYTWGQYAGVLNGTLKGREGGIVGNGVVKNGDGTFSKNTVVVPAENFYKAMYVNGVVETAVFDASYIKFRQLQLGYQLPNSIMGKLPFRDVNIALVGRNLAILYSKAPHIDPESAFSNSNGEQGQEFGQIPSTRSIGFNINFKL